MDGLATEAGRYLLTQGVLGTAVLLLGLAVVLLYRELRAKDRAFTDLTGKLAELAASSVAAGAAQASVLERMNGTADARTRAIDELTRDHGLLGSDVRHGLNQVLQVLQGVVERLRDMPGRRS